MAKRLVQLQDGRRVRSWDLGRLPERTILGREDEADVVVDHLRASRRHALIEEVTEGHVLTDLESANGTFLNGERIDHGVLLEPGDEISVAGEVVLLYAPPRHIGWMLVAGLVLLLALGAAGIAWQVQARYWYWAPHWDDTVAEARDTAGEGLDAWLAGDAPAAKRQIQAAYWLLYSGDRLADVPREDVWDVGLARLNEALGGETDLREVFREVAAPPPAEVARIEEADTRPGCRLDEVGPAELEPCLEEWVDYVCAELRQDPERIPDWFYGEVGRSLRHESGRISRAIDRGEPYVPAMKIILEEARMPPLLHYLSMAESGYQADALSTAGALGQWQFMPATARRYGLMVSGPVDERRDPGKSTRAAAEYLRDLALEFGGDSLLLALAGYNRGENGVRGALRKLDDPFSDRSYWTLVEEELLPAETRHYVARIFAQAVAGEGGVPSPTTLKRAGFTGGVVTQE